VCYNSIMKFGTHNLHDEAGRPTAFADIIVFTEAVASEVRDALEPKGYVVVVCSEQKDLVIAYKKGTFVPKGKPHYRLIHGGVAGVTPHRGTFWLKGTLRGKKTVVIVEHRINAAFAPFVRGEPKFRQSMWRKHTRFTVGLIKRFIERGWVVLAGGDLNTIRSVKGYRGTLKEYGQHFDRLGTHGVRSRGFVVLSRAGSDHPRILVEI